MSSSLLVCLCVCFPHVISFGYFPPQQEYQGPLRSGSNSGPVARWEAYTDHTNWHGPTSQSAKSGSYSFRADWTGQQTHERSPETQRRVYSRETNVRSETGFVSSTPEIRPRTYQPYSADQIGPQVSISHRQLYNHQPFKPDPDPAYWARSSSQENSRDRFSKRLQVVSQEQKFDQSPRINWLRDTDSYDNPLLNTNFGKEDPPFSPTLNRDGEVLFVGLTSPKQKNAKIRTTQESYLGKDNSPEQSILDQRYVDPPFSPTLNRDGEVLFVGLTSPKQKNAKIRTTQESYLGKDNSPEQSILDQRYVDPPFSQPSPSSLNHAESYGEDLTDQIKWFKSNRLLPRLQQDSFIVQSPWNGQINYNFAPSLNVLGDSLSTLLGQRNPKLESPHPPTTLKEANTNVALPQFKSTTENTKWFEYYNPTEPHAPDFTLYHDKLTHFRDLTVPVTTSSPDIEDEPTWHSAHTQILPSHKEKSNTKDKFEHFSPAVHPSNTFASSDIGLNLPTTKPNASHLDGLKQQIDGFRYDDRNGGVPIQHPGPEGQWELCEGPGGNKGHCVPAESCDLEGSYQHYSLTQKYYCIIRHKQSIGICCINVKEAPSQDHQAAASPFVQEVDHADHIIGPPDHDHHHHHHEHCIYPIAEYKVCGRSGKMMSNITAPAAASVRDWPWMAVFVFRSTMSQFCGGTLITRRHVLTAAHCFRTIDPDDILVLLGDFDVRQPNESMSRAFSVERLISNDDYDPGSHENDIALLVLNTTTVYNNYIQPACLPVPGPRYTNESSVLTGWGVIQYRGRLPTNLMEAPLPVWDQDVCIPKFAQTIFNTSMCAGAFEGGRDSCQGDSGGPLVKQCHHSNRWVVIGIVSWGIRCGERDKPGVYTRVNEYLDWIHENIIDNSTDTTETSTVSADTLLPFQHF